MVERKNMQEVLRGTQTPLDRKKKKGQLKQI